MTVISNLLNHQPLEAVLGYNNSAILTHCTLELLEPSSIMSPSVNIVWDSSLEKSFCVHVVYILSKLGNISCMTARDSTNIGTLEGILYLIFCYSSNLTLMPFPLIRMLFCHIVFSITCILSFSCFFSFYFSLFIIPSPFFFFLPCCFSLHVCSYEVATIVCPHTLCNKLLIFLKKKSWTILFLLSFFPTKNTSAIWGDFEGLIYPFLNCSLMNLHTSPPSSLDNRYIFSFLGTNSFFSIVWSHIFLIGILSLTFFLKMWIHL